MREL
jgi:hypothetical protein